MISPHSTRPSQTGHGLGFRDCSLTCLNQPVIIVKVMIILWSVAIVSAGRLPRDVLVVLPHRYTISPAIGSFDCWQCKGLMMHPTLLCFGRKPVSLLDKLAICQRLLVRHRST